MIVYNKNQALNMDHCLGFKRSAKKVFFEYPHNNHFSFDYDSEEDAKAAFIRILVYLRNKTDTCDV